MVVAGGAFDLLDIAPWILRGVSREGTPGRPAEQEGGTEWRLLVSDRSEDVQRLGLAFPFRDATRPNQGLHLDSALGGRLRSECFANLRMPPFVDVVSQVEDHRDDRRKHGKWPGQHAELKHDIWSEGAGLGLWPAGL